MLFHYRKRELKPINDKYKTIFSDCDQINLSIKTSSTFVLYISGKGPNIEVFILVNTLSADLGLEPNLIMIDTQPNISVHKCMAGATAFVISAN